MNCTTTNGPWNINFHRNLNSEFRRVGFSNGVRRGFLRQKELKSPNNQEEIYENSKIDDGSSHH